MSWLADLLKALTATGGRAVRPRSSNGASSFHLAWEFPLESPASDGFLEVSVVLEIVVPPSVSALYFWALQVDFVAAGSIVGGAHTGLQWNPRYPRHRAVNWGGYASAERGGSVLPGTRSTLNGFGDDPNTLEYAWEPGRQYRLRVFRSPDIADAWRSEVTDLSSGRVDTVRDLMPREEPAGEDGYLLRPVVWTEVFAACDAPSVTARWSDPRAVDRRGTPVRPTMVRVNYQSREAGGCSNTTADVDGAGGLLQTTNTTRYVKQGEALETRSSEASSTWPGPTNGRRAR